VKHDGLTFHIHELNRAASVPIHHLSRRVSVRIEEISGEGERNWRKKGSRDCGSGRETELTHCLPANQRPAWMTGCCQVSHSIILISLGGVCQEEKKEFWFSLMSVLWCRLSGGKSFAFVAARPLVSFVGEAALERHVVHFFSCVFDRCA
jgi:hypothetical protein